jgi:translation initiation factor 2B subunit (eIF-2B alpha/beta/delta family)
MAYKNDLQLAYSGREIALQRIEIIDSTVFDDEAARNYSEARRTKYQRLLERSDERIADIKSRIAEDIGVKKSN